MQNKDLFGGIVGKYSNRMDENKARRNDECNIASDSSAPSRPSGLGYRHLQIVLLFFGLFMAYTLRVNISVGIVAMVNQSPNATHETYNWDKKQQNLILSSFFWGYLIGQIPIGLMAQRYGAKMLLAFGSIVCALLTLVTPNAASLDWRVMLATRALQGLFQGFYYPCTHTLLAKWVHPSERGVLATIVYSGTQAGSVAMLAISGVLASSSLGWPGIFYCSGGVTLLWTIAWIIFGSSAPEKCSRISVEERKFIESMPGSSQTQLSVPWLSVLRSVPVMALIIVHATQCWGFWSLLTETPTYLHEIFDFDIKTNSLVSALPYFAMYLISLAVSPISDFLINRNYISVTTGRKLFNSFGHWVPALTLIALPFMHGSTEAVAMLTLGIGFNGFTYCGYMLNHMDLSPNFAGSLMGLTNSLANIMSILGPLAVGYILTDTTDVEVKLSEWRIIYFIAAGFFFFGNLIFVIFGTAVIQPWNDPNGNAADSDNNVKSDPNTTAVRQQRC